jgi:flavin reductase (DIM6/NTAB) family NADH-FMN oxidoreductase RutF
MAREELRPSPLPSVAADTLKSATAAWATGVVVVTAGLPDGRRAGLVMVSLAPVSHDPPLVLWSVDRRSGSIDVWLGARGYALHVLAADQEELAWRFARSGGDKFDGLETRIGLVDAPILGGALATLECEMHAQHDGGDHVILVGRVVAAATTDRPPLVMHAGRTHRLGQM